MEDLLSKEHCCYKIHTLSMKSSVYPSPPSIDNRLCMDYPLFLQETFDLPILWFFKNPNSSYIRGGGEGVHTMGLILYLVFSEAVFEIGF